MNDRYFPFGALVLRIALGTVLVAHSLYLKLMVFTLPGTASFFESLGLSGWFAYLVFAVEAVGGALMIIGYKTRICAAVVIPILLGATWAHAQNGWLFTAENGGWEYPLFLAVVALGILMTGPGAYALDHRQAAAPEQREAAFGHTSTMTKSR